MTPVIFAIIVCMAFFVEATLGFGATIVAVTLGIFVLPLDILLPSFVPINIILSSYIVLRYHDDIRWGFLLKRIIPLMCLGMPLGMVLFQSGQQALLLFLYGLFVVVLSAMELYKALRTGSIVEPTPLKFLTLVLMLVAGGVIHGAYATGGPMAVYVSGREGMSKGAFRSSLSLLWLVLNLVLVMGYAVGGDLTPETGRISLILVIPLLLGLFMGDRAHSRINSAVFLKLVFALLLIAGMIVLVKSKPWDLFP